MIKLIETQQLWSVMMTMKCNLDWTMPRYYKSMASSSWSCMSG